MTSNNNDNQYHKVIYIDTSGHRIQDPAKVGQYRQPQNISYALPQRLFAPGVTHDNSRPGSSRNSVPWEPVQDQPQPAGPQEEEEPPRMFYPDQQQVFENIPQQQRFVPRSVLVQESPDEQRYHYPTPNFT